MADQVAFPELARQIGEAARSVMDEIRPRLVEAALSGDRSERANTRHAGNLLTSHDLWAHDRYRQLITRLLPAGFVHASEEADPEVIGDDPDPDLCVLVDPLDTSEPDCLPGRTHRIAPAHPRLRAAASAPHAEVTSQPKLPGHRPGREARTRSPLSADPPTVRDWACSVRA